MQSAEIELKFLIADAAALEAQLPALGFHLDTPRTFEQNTLYDTPERRLRETQQILRIRQYGDLWTVTHKRPDTVDGDPRYKIRIETETHVDDAPAIAEIFCQLGYCAMFRYEKYRTEWSHPTEDAVSPLHLVIDETPIGVYGELEGPTVWIDRMLEALHIDPADCTTKSYGKLFLDWKARTESSAENLTFDEVEAGVVAVAVSAG
jgi:adenylate cyclase class 2